MERDYVYVIERWFDQYEYLGIAGVFAARGLAEAALVELQRLDTAGDIFRIQACRLGVIEEPQEVEWLRCTYSC